MPTRLTPLVTDQYYHLYNRGINKQPIFFSVKDYKRVMEIIEFYSFVNVPIRFSRFLLLSTEDKEKIWFSLRKENEKLVQFICYCFMPNHFHFLLKQIKDNGISRFMRIFQNSYTRYFNSRHQRIGPLLQGQFKAVRVEDDEQLLHLSRYIHLNPYTSYVLKTVENLYNYSWSSLPEYIGVVSNPICNKELVLSNFKSTQNYLKFICDQADYQRELDKIKHQTLEF